MRSRQSLLCILAAVVVVITAAGSNAIELVGRATMVQADSIPMGLPGDTVWDFLGVRPLPGSKTWVASKMGDSVLAVACGDSQLTYLERNDSLYWLGFENPSTEMRETGTVRAARPSAIAAGVQPCKYTGKELDRQAGLDLYDFAARQLDPALGRTSTQDPMAEKYYSISPYAWCASNPIRNVDPTGNFLLENMDIENYNYPLVAVFFSNRDKVLEDDYMAAKNANMPIMVVDNMGGDFTNAMSCFTNMLGCSTDIYTINSHGSPGALSVPNEDNSDFVNMDFTSDFTALKDGLSDKIVFIGACNVGEGFTGSTFTQLMSLQTNSTVITSEQPIKAGYKYDGGPDLVPSSFQFYNHYKMSEKGLLPSEITDVKMDKNRGITWRENYFWSKPYNSDNKVSTLWFQQ